MANLVEKREFTPKKFYAGEFPVVTDTRTAGKKVAQYDMIMSVTDDTSGAVTLEPATTAGIANVVGIAVNAAEADEPVVYIMTGEVFADAVNIGTVDTAAAKAALRKLSIFLK